MGDDTPRFKDTKTEVIIAKEAPGKCELCGAVAETRPYGPKGEEICIGCGLKNPAAAVAAMKARFQKVGLS